MAGGVEVGGGGGEARDVGSAPRESAFPIVPVRATASLPSPVRHRHGGTIHVERQADITADAAARDSPGSPVSPAPAGVYSRFAVTDGRAAYEGREHVPCRERHPVSMMDA